LYGYDYVTSAYEESPSESGDRIMARIKEKYPRAEEKQIKKVLK
jgi:hypothetical protein